jgi:phosphoglycerate kinase
VNGPLGNYEEGFDAATKALLKEIAAQKKAVTIVGGGDSVALVQKLKLEKEFSFVSTGGGAMLEFLAKGKLPGVDALR